MRTAQLGGGLVTSAIGLGCMRLACSGMFNRRRSLRTLAQAVESGVTLLDTADVYGESPGCNEQLLGQALAKRRDDVVIATKVGLRFGAGGMIRTDGTAEWVREACEQSLRRLHTPYIDLCYLHRKDPSVPIEVTVSAMAKLVHRGDIRHIGLSEVNSATLRAAHAVHPISAVQMEYSLFTRSLETDLLATCRNLGIGIVAYRPIAGGLLGGGIRSVSDIAPTDPRRRNPRFSPGNLEANLHLAGEVRRVADTLGCSPAQVAIAWILAQAENIAAIPGTTDRNHLAENIAAADVTLGPRYLARLEAVARHVKGDRLTPESDRYTMR